MADAPRLRIDQGTCHAVFAFDVGREIRVDAAARVLTAAPSPPARPGRPPSLAFRRPPVRCTVRIGPIDVGGVRTLEDATAVLYEFGAVAVVVSMQATGTLDDLASLGAALCATDAVAAAARGAVEDLVRRLGDAIDGPEPAEMLEEYLVFHVAHSTADIPVSQWVEVHGRELAAVLRAETAPLSSQEIAQTLATPVAYAPADLVLVDWNAAFVVRDRVDDLLAVLTFANVQLLEMRWLDTRLDESLEASYEAVHRREPRSVLVSTSYREALESIARRQIDAALLFEHVRNAPKLLGDQYLARVYESAARRFRLRDWDDSIHRKLDVLGTIYERLRDRTAILRAEILEWIIILLCVLSVVVPFMM